MTKVAVGRTDDFSDPSRKVVDIDGVEIGVFFRDGVFTAYENICPHMAGPVCQGKIIGRVEEVILEDQTSAGMCFSKSNANVVCPWHGYEFDIRTGRHQGNPRISLRKVEIEIVDGLVVVTVPEGSESRVSLSRLQGKRQGHSAGA